MGDLKIVVAGCVASQEGQALLRRVPELDLVMGPHHANRSVKLMSQSPAFCPSLLLTRLCKQFADESSYE